MASGKQVSKSTLQGWVNNFVSNKDLPFITNSAAISLPQLENYIAEAKAKYPAGITGFRIYFVRYPFNDNSPALVHLQKAGKNVSQPSVVFVPLGNYNRTTGWGNDLTLPGQDDLYVLTFSTAETDSDDDTAPCPPKCGIPPGN